MEYTSGEKERWRDETLLGGFQSPAAEGASERERKNPEGRKEGRKEILYPYFCCLLSTSPG
jgi:hypothetical protein